MKIRIEYSRSATFPELFVAKTHDGPQHTYMSAYSAESYAAAREKLISNVKAAYAGEPAPEPEEVEI